MKNRLYILLMCMFALAACQQNTLDEQDGAGEGVTLSPQSGVAGLSSKALASIVQPLHLLIYDAEGRYVQTETYSSLDKVSPVRLALGRYTFAYLSNAEQKQITGLQEGASLSDVFVSVAASEDGNAYVGEIFAGRDTVVVGEDRESSAALTRLVGRMDVTLTGIPQEAQHIGLRLGGSAQEVSYEGTPRGSEIGMPVSLSLNDTLAYVGNVIAFPTLKDTVASLTLNFSKDNREYAYSVILKNRVEANKIHRICLNYQAAGEGGDEPGNLSALTVISSELLPWGETSKEEVAIGEGYFTDVEFTFTSAADAAIKWEKATSLEVSLLKAGDLENKTYRFYNLLFENNVAKAQCKEILAGGDYKLVAVRATDSLGQMLYRSESSQQIRIDATRQVDIKLPKMASVGELEKQALFELREIYRNLKFGVVASWTSDDIALWEDIELDAEGHVIGIGWDALSELNEADQSLKMSGQGIKTMSNEIMDGEDLETYELPASFRNLTYLKYFTENLGKLAKMPDYLAEMTALEQLKVRTDAEVLPALPNLKYLDFESNHLTELPAAIEQMTNLQYLCVKPVYWNKNADDQLLRKPSLHTINVDFSRLTNLQYLCLVGSETCALPETIWKCQSLKELGLYGFNDMRVPPLDLPHLNELTLSNKSMTFAHIDNIRTLPISYLEILHSSLGNLENGKFIGEITSLSEIEFRNCSLSGSIPESWAALNKLQYLDLRDNPQMTGQLPSALLEVYNQDNLFVNVQNCGTFSPDGILLTVSRDRLLFPKEGGSIAIDIRCNYAWTIEFYGSDLVRIDKKEGSGDGQLVVTMPAFDPENPPHFSTIDIRSGKHMVSIIVEQEGY